LILCFLVTVIDQQNTAAVKSEALQPRYDSRQTMKAMYNCWDVLGEETIAIPEIRCKNVSELVFFDVAPGVLVLRDKFLLDFVPDLLILWD
jgi:hypothetical protein